MYDLSKDSDLVRKPNKIVKLDTSYYVFKSRIKNYLLSHLHITPLTFPYFVSLVSYCYNLYYCVTVITITTIHIII